MKNAQLTQSFADRLQEELADRSNRNPSYSLRAFAKSLDVDHSTLSKFLTGARKPGTKVILKLGAKIGLSPEEISFFIESSKGNAPSGFNSFESINADNFKVISDWYHYAILELMAVEDFKPDFEWVAESLGITKNQVEVAIKRLERVGLLRVTAEGEWVDRSSGFSTTLDTPYSTSAFRRLQRQVLEKAIIALDEIPMQRRNQTSMTTAVSIDKIPEAISMITKFRRKLGRFLKSKPGENQEVYHVSISMYPITNLKGEKNETDH